MVKFKPGDLVRVTVGPDAGRVAKVVRRVNTLVPGASIRFEDGEPPRDPARPRHGDGVAITEYSDAALERV